MATTKKPKVSDTAAKKEVPVKTVAAPAKRTPSTAFMKPLTPSAALAAVIGSTPMPRTAVVKELWVYIKKHGLQDAINKRNINADAKLKVVFGKDQVTMFEMAGLIGKHLK
jgi:chromatin remodeling complex protein RSC6